VGPVKAMELIKKYGRLENIEGYDKEKIESFIELRKLFRIDYPLMKKYVNKDIDEEALYNFMEEKRIRVGRNKVEEVIKKINKKVELVFADEMEE
jgi:hypothetical protein